ncbi:response regulator [Duganella sp. FT92W]|uniref:Response regulator n=1 Tax=Pseudoduganella rivuli TaxID=2666085 RepID=A0A7X2IJZ1_9BURK|nr:response regulator [Pseudoduganella rivuli]MRV71195.1 response regulator [Pseudoduganella rivuli]
MARVLIIEDNQPNMDLLAYLLSAFGHQPLCAYDGVEGVELARDALPDLIVCDLHLPRLDGYGVVRSLKGDPRTRAIPVLAASALPVSDGGEALRAAGFDGHLPKSLEPDALIPSLEAWLAPHQRGVAPDSHDGAAVQDDAATLPGARRLLLLDAAPDNCGLAASIAGHLGYSITTAATAAQADACAGQSFDLLLCDLDGPEDHANALLDAAARHWPTLPMVAIRAADSDAISPAIAARHPAPVLLAHPLEPQQLAAALDAALPVRST